MHANVYLSLLYNCNKILEILYVHRLSLNGIQFLAQPVFNLLFSLFIQFYPTSFLISNKFSNSINGIFRCGFRFTKVPIIQVFILCP